MLTSISQVDLSPIPGKTYFSFEREWREEFIYFLMVDRFQDDKARQPVLKPDRALGVQVPDNAFYGGKIRGITRNLDYIAGLGCTAIWLSPVFENNSGAYHGYNISDYLEIDPHFGTEQDLIDLVEAAHRRNPPMRVILDVVINHSGDNWAYPGNVPYYYWKDQQYNLGFWRRPDRPIPTELRQENFYHRCGEIRNYNDDGEVQHGDICSLKDFANDDPSRGETLVDILVRSHCYWIRNADVDGFRVDAVKHMNAASTALFSSMVREYAYSLGKHSFFLFGEVASPSDEIYDRYLGQNTSKTDGVGTIHFGLNSVLDFRLAEGAGDRKEPLRDVLKGFAGPETLFDRLASQQYRALSRGEIGKYLVTFIDNHDSFWQPGGRVGFQAPEEQIIASIGYLLCSLGTACIYYGTEQGFQGHGGDNAMREAMFDVNSSTTLLNPDCRIYRAISDIAKIMRKTEPLRFGRMYFRQISEDGIHFGLPYGKTYTLAFSRMLYNQEVLVAYNVSADPRKDAVVIDSVLHQPGDKLTYLYPKKKGKVLVEKSPDGTHFVRLDLKGREFVILQ